MKLELFDRRRHDACGYDELDTWIRRFAARSQRDSLTRVFVMVEDGDDKPPILGYFALSMSSVAVSSLSESDRRRLPRCPVPAVLLTRLAVATSAQGRGFGSALLYKAAQKALLANDLVAARLLVVDAIDDRAASFYRRFGFVASPDDARRLYIALDRLRTHLP